MRYRSIGRVVFASALLAGAGTASAEGCIVGAAAGGEPLELKGHGPVKGKVFVDDCQKIVVKTGMALVQYIDAKEQPARVVVKAGDTFHADMAPSEAAKVVGRGLAMLTTPGSTSSAGQKYFDKPSQVGAPFGDVYLPPEGLSVALFGVDAGTQVRILDGATSLVTSTVPAHLKLDRKSLQAGKTYSVEIQSPGGKQPRGAFAIVDKEQSASVDSALKAIAQDAQLDAASRNIARALLYESEGLGFNRELTIRESTP